ncbi:CHAT domain-containing protein [Fodinibacter luteus]|uniref:CHAT domain-containing protein n=1 Tax=Fodinibacter luteus TaxID=552064 RepID=A0ABP8KM81_9MICO
MGRFDEAAAWLDDALAGLAASGDPGAEWLATRILITRSWSELEVRGLGSALEMLADARARAHRIGDPLLVALTCIQEGTLHGRVGDWGSCLAALQRVGADESSLDPAQQWALHLNLGQSHLGLGHTTEAATEFEQARDIAAEHGLVDQEFKARHNRAVVAFVDGDLPRALLLMREADAMDAAVARDRARLDHAEVLLEAGLVDRARSALEDALAGARSGGHRLEEGEIDLRLARCDLLVNDLDGARAHIRAATAAFRTRQAEELVAEAEIIRATIDVAAGHDVQSVVTTLSRTLDRPGARPAAHRAAVRLDAEARLLLGDVGGAERRLATLDGADRDSLGARLHETLVRARLDLARGRPAEAERRIVTGNRLIAAHQFQSSSLDVRAALALHGRRLAIFDAERAVAVGDVDGILTSVERWRAISHRINPVTTATDPEVATLTRELRRLRQLAADDGDSGGDLTARIAALEDQVAQREWALTVDGARAATVAAVGADEARATASERDVTVVEFFELDDHLWTIEVSAGALSVRRTAPVVDATRLVTRLRRDLRARAIVAVGSPLAPMLERAATASLVALDAALNPGGPGSARVVVIPSRSLAAVPWSLLPSLYGRPVTVAPSLTRWVRGPARAATPVWTDTVAALYGPGLARTRQEVGAVRAAWAGSQEPDPAGPATSEEVLRALGSARVVHLAAHGIHEAQSPLFSSVLAADGPVFAREFPRPVAAEHVALSACDVGQFSSRPGDEPLGLAIALISLGATSVLGAVAPVSDDVAAEAMVAYHRLLASGADASTAWGQVVEQHPAAGVFCYYGSEWSVR